MTPRKRCRTVKCFCGAVLTRVRPNRRHCSASCRVRACRWRKWLREARVYDEWGDELAVALSVDTETGVDDE